MRPTQILRLAFLSIITKRLRMLLTLGGIALSVGVIVLLLGLGQGIKGIVTNQISKTDGQNVVTISSNRVKELKLNQEALAKLTSISGVSSLEQSVAVSGRATYHDITVGAPVYGVSAGYMAMSRTNVLAGENITASNESKDSVVISTGVARAFGIDRPADAIGRTISFTTDIPSTVASKQTTDTKSVEGKNFIVGGIVDKGNAPVIYLPLDYLAHQGVDIATEVKVALDSPDKMAAVRGGIEQMGFETSSIRDTIDQVNQLFGLIQTILIVFGIITLVIAVFGTLNTITIDLVQQTKQIGFLRVIGIRKQDVGTLFMLQAIILASVGVVFGIVGGVIFGSFLNGIVMAVAHSNGVTDSLQVFQIPVGVILLLVPAAVGLGWIIGFGPAKRAIGISPLAAIRGSQ